ncbi:hypothetical protein FRC02_003878 [Tulasnella sp. 418]|nr:hypothetical protein FRC02_003878 [Tulasnella sp. 418]
MSNSASTFGISEIQHLDVSRGLILGNRVSLGGYSDVYQGTMQTKRGRVKVAIKELRIPAHLLGERFQKHFLREVKVWIALEHPNIVQFLGYAIDSGGFPRLISPWYDHGDLQKYILNNPEANRPQLGNILVNEQGKACLCDFGAARVLNGVSGLTTSGQNAKATRRFMSPERLTEEGPPTIASDVWAFGCVVIEVMANRLPYGQIKNELAVYTKIHEGVSPLDPQYDTSGEPGPLFWAFIRKCWRVEPERRPTIDQLLDHFRTSFPSRAEPPRPSVRRSRSIWSPISWLKDDGTSDTSIKDSNRELSRSALALNLADQLRTPPVKKTPFRRSTAPSQNGN